MEGTGSLALEASRPSAVGLTAKDLPRQTPFKAHDLLAGSLKVLLDSLKVRHGLVHRLCGCKLPGRCKGKLLLSLMLIRLS